MANMHSSDTTNPKTPSFGTSDNSLPSILPYPGFLADTQAATGVFCYVISHYGREGLSVLIQRQPDQDQAAIICGDWYGNKLDLEPPEETPLARHAAQFITQDVMRLYELMRTIHINQAQFFLAPVEGELTLVDVQTSVNKMSSPGMIRDVFGKVFPTQRVIETAIMDEDKIKHIKEGRGDYGGDLILKPSRFRMYECAGDYRPLYVEILRK